MSQKTIKEYFDFYIKKVLPVLKGLTKQTPEGYHGLHTHTEAVVFRGIDYALALKKNPIPVIFACAIHDAARVTDYYDETHGAEALPIAKKVMSHFPSLLDEEQQKSILFAIDNHTRGRQPPDYISACLWDADRTRLSWEKGYRADCFTTPKAKKIASHDFQPYLDYMQQCIGRQHSEHE